MTFVSQGNLDLNGATVRQCGDINLVASVMAMGISLEKEDPVSVVDTKYSTKPYGSFRLADQSDDGTVDLDTLMAAWSGSIALGDGHPFSQICRFIKSRPNGMQRTDDLLDYAIQYLQDLGHKMPGLRDISDVPAFVNALPNGEASYVLAYIWNRQLCFDIMRMASRRVHYSREENGTVVKTAILDTRLPRWKSVEMLSMFDD